jgi:hypothetical protein
MADDECRAVRAELAARAEEIATLRGAVAALRTLHQKESNVLRAQQEQARRWVSAQVVVALFVGCVMGAVVATATLVSLGSTGASAGPKAPSASARVSGDRPAPDRDSGVYASSESGPTQLLRPRLPSPSRGSSP